MSHIPPFEKQIVIINEDWKNASNFEALFLLYILHCFSQSESFYIVVLQTLLLSSYKVSHDLPQGYMKQFHALMVAAYRLKKEKNMVISYKTINQVTSFHTAKKVQNYGHGK